MPLTLFGRPMTELRTLQPSSAHKDTQGVMQSGGVRGWTHARVRFRDSLSSSPRLSVDHVLARKRWSLGLHCCWAVGPWPVARQARQTFRQRRSVAACVSEEQGKGQERRNRRSNVIAPPPPSRSLQRRPNGHLRPASETVDSVESRGRWSPLVLCAPHSSSGPTLSLASGCSVRKRRMLSLPDGRWNADLRQEPDLGLSWRRPRDDVRRDRCLGHVIR